MKTAAILIILAGAILLLLSAFHPGVIVGWFTEPLRLLTNSAQSFDYITRLIVLLFALAVAIIGTLAYQRQPQSRIGLVALAFGLLAFKWLLKVMDLFVSDGQFFPDHAENVIELVSLALIAYALFGRHSSKKG
ncbi:MAG: hypothetical protein Q8P05_02180 [Candidatus Diapherotrites archaeon]|nr:hypothetical protein [Candidatus Diapherotrites archaeon]MDZ4256328.1 hypothetical protein [archaeon]